MVSILTFLCLSLFGDGCVTVVLTIALLLMMALLLTTFQSQFRIAIDDDHAISSHRFVAATTLTNTSICNCVIAAATTLIDVSAPTFATNLTRAVSYQAVDVVLVLVLVLVVVLGVVGAVGVVVGVGAAEKQRI